MISIGWLQKPWSVLATFHSVPAPSNLGGASRTGDGLGDLRREVETLLDSGEGRFCAKQWWYVHFKLRMMKLVGDLAEQDDPVICSSESYDLAYPTLYDLLPRCRHEGGCYWGPEK
jgi:hypothetical protein